MKVIIAMSGGVDSSVAAYLLKKKGLDVIGLSFELWDKRDLKSSGTCCSVETVALAQSVALKLGIEHYTVDVRDAFYRHVIETFCESYIDGITPNPCILCNKYIKFEFLRKKAEEMGAQAVATGHYARIEKGAPAENGGLTTANGRRFLLKKGLDLKKDQSYVLHVMKQEELAMTLFPLGEMKKDMTRMIAGDLGLANALRAESQEICFVGSDTYADFIRDYSPVALRPGTILDTGGKVVGRHKGIALYTIGQRKGLGIPSLKPLYVSEIDRTNNTITVGSREDAMSSEFTVKNVNWIAVDSLKDPVQAAVKIRSTMKEVPGLIRPADHGRVIVALDEPQWAPAPGQSAVFYIGDIVLGGGIIE